MKLNIELVPQTCHYKNVRSNVSKQEWDKLRKECYAKAKYKCEICGGRGTKHPVECHEIWYYDDNKRIQSLKGLISLCPTCHMVKHIGLARINGNYELAFNHFMKVNNYSKELANIEINKAFRKWEERSSHTWTLDISWLQNKNKSNHLIF